MYNICIYIFIDKTGKRTMVVQQPKGGEVVLGQSLPPENELFVCLFAQYLSTHAYTQSCKRRSTLGTAGTTTQSPQRRDARWQKKKKEKNEARAARPKYCCQVSAMRPPVAHLQVYPLKNKGCLPLPILRSTVCSSPPNICKTHTPPCLPCVTDRKVCMPERAELDPQLFQNSRLTHTATSHTAYLQKH